MTGIASEEMARLALERLISMNADKAIWPKRPTIAKLQVCMMNSDYNVGAPIRRERLYKILVEEYGLWCNYEPTIYQGVNTKYFWNSCRPADAPPGICTCPQQCKGDGAGDAIGACKKITISPFRTGSVIVTGAQHSQQLYDAYNFINSVFASHPEILREPEPVACKAKPKKELQGVLNILAHRIRTSPRGLVKIAVN